MSDLTTPLEQPTKPKPRRYASLTGDQFFTDEYNADPYSQYWDPYNAGNTDGGDLAQMYAGTPVVRGYYETDEEGNEGAFVAEENLYDTASAMQSLQSTTTPTWEEWLAQQSVDQQGYMLDANGQRILDETGNPVMGSSYQNIYDTEAWAGLQSLLQDFGTTDEDMDAAREEQAIANGFFERDIDGNILYDAQGGAIADVDGFLDYITSSREQIDQGVMAQPGLDDPANAARSNMMKRLNQRGNEQLIESNARMIESLGQVSSAAAYQKMGEVSGQIADANIRFQVQYLEQDMLLRELEYNALVDRYGEVQKIANDASNRFATMLVNNRMGALQAYATQITSIIQNNADLRTGYGQELERIAAHADLQYKTIMTQIGYDEHEMQMSEDRYNQFMAPFWEDMEMWFQSETIRQGDLQNMLSTGDWTLDANGNLVPKEDKQFDDDPGFWTMDSGAAGELDTAGDVVSIGGAALGGVATGASVGAAVGMIFPPLAPFAAAGGAVIGGLIGLFSGIFAL